ncbi:MAG: MBL fold metallo-hydrolase [Pirellulaceae bacterium]|nr:MBL fold metallo-hydrolase [Pirellulaceae bacterium]
MRRVFSLIVASLLACGFAEQTLAASPGQLQILWIDTEGGAATLIVTPAGESVLIDTGNPGVRDADRIVKVATRDAGVKRIDHLITTHYHRDHFGGAATLSKLIPIGHVYDNGNFEGMPEKPDQPYLSFACEKRSVIHPGSTIELKQLDGAPPVRMLCLATRQAFIKPDEVDARDNREIGSQHRPKDRDGSDNANSVVMLLAFGGFRFFDAGDLTWNQEVRLVHPYDLVGPVDVYQVTHHGLDASNNPVVLRTIKPTVAIMNNGHTKGCAPDVFADLKETSSVKAIYQVHKNLRPDGAMANAPDEFIANHTAADKCEGHPIILTVDKDAANYTVSLPSRNHQATYKTRTVQYP